MFCVLQAALADTRRHLTGAEVRQKKKPGLGTESASRLSRTRKTEEHHNAGKKNRDHHKSDDRDLGAAACRWVGVEKWIPAVNASRKAKEKAGLWNANCVQAQPGGRGDRTRTCGLVVPNHARYQLRNTSIQLPFLGAFLLYRKNRLSSMPYSVYTLANPPSLVSRYLENRSLPVSYMVFTTMSKEIFRV